MRVHCKNRISDERIQIMALIGWAELFDPAFRNHQGMQQIYSWSWVEAQVAQTIEVWHRGAAQPAQDGPRYSLKEQQKREKAYDQGLRAVEREVSRTPRTRAARLERQNRIVASFARFSATALDLDEETIKLLTDDFLPVGTRLARWARQFDPSLGMADIIQACRNAWTACGLQPLLGERVGITPSILGYSLLYPYSDNYLDREDISAEAKLHFSERFRNRLCGERLSAQDDREAALWALVRLIEDQYPRAALSPGVRVSVGHSPGAGGEYRATAELQPFPRRRAVAHELREGWQFCSSGCLPGPWRA